MNIWVSREVKLFQSSKRKDTLWHLVELVAGNAELADGRSHYIGWKGRKTVVR